MEQSENTIKQIALFGTKVGLAFQIKDDIFDYGTADIGKPLAIDLKEKKMTLPLIYTLNNCLKSDKKKVIKIFKKKHIDKADVNYIVNLVKKHKGIAYAEKRMFELRDQAKDIITPYIKKQQGPFGIS